MKATHNFLLRPIKHQKKQLTFLKAISLFISILHTQDKNHNKSWFYAFRSCLQDFVIWGLKFQIINNWPCGTVVSQLGLHLSWYGGIPAEISDDQPTQHNFCSGPLVPDLHNSGCAVQYCHIRSQHLVNI